MTTSLAVNLPHIPSKDIQPSTSGDAVAGPSTSLNESFSSYTNFMYRHSKLI